MCANYSPTRGERLAAFGVDARFDTYKEEVYPGDFAPIIRNGMDGGLSSAIFGMVPPWAEEKLARSTYNARAETVHQKPSFRNAWKSRQFCIIPADRVYEPNYESGKAVRNAISSIDGAPLGLAGIWEEKAGRADGVPIYSFTMLTINADGHPVMRRLFRPEDEKRMTVMLDPTHYGDWLSASESDARDLMRCFAAERLVLSEAPRPPRAKAATVEDEPSLF
jgi:putative SOS response-associated peptidase YedK